MKDHMGPLGLPDQIKGLPTSPSDRGDETQERFRYQWAMGVLLIAEGFHANPSHLSIWCEYHDDFVIELANGKFVAVQVKTDDAENVTWRITDEALVASIQRFCVLEKNSGDSLERYEFCSNAKPYIPSAGAKKQKTIASSPVRLIAACVRAESPEKIDSPELEVFNILHSKLIDVEKIVLLSVLRKLIFRQGPSVRDCDAVLAADVITSLPGCSGIPQVAARRLREGLISIVQAACRARSDGLDGCLAYIAANGQPANMLRNKCITIQSAKGVIDQLRQTAFQFVECGLGINTGPVVGRLAILEKKARNAYISSYVEALRWRMESAERRFMERAISDPDNFEAVATQVTGKVLTICKDVEAKSFGIADERQRGPNVYAKVVEALEKTEETNPGAVCGESIDALMGVAAMLSGECRFTWGVPLDEGDGHGA